MFPYSSLYFRRTESSLSFVSATSSLSGRRMDSGKQIHLFDGLLVCSWKSLAVRQFLVHNIFGLTATFSISLHYNQCSVHYCAESPASGGFWDHILPERIEGDVIYSSVGYKYSRDYTYLLQSLVRSLSWL